MKYFIKHKDQIVGPFTQDELNNYIKKNQLGSDLVCSQEDTPDQFRPIQNFPELSFQEQDNDYRTRVISLVSSFFKRQTDEQVSAEKKEVAPPVAVAEAPLKQENTEKTNFEKTLILRKKPEAIKQENEKTKVNVKALEEFKKIQEQKRVEEEKLKKAEELKRQEEQERNKKELEAVVDTESKTQMININQLLNKGQIEEIELDADQRISELEKAVSEEKEKEKQKKAELKIAIAPPKKQKSKIYLLAVFLLIAYLVLDDEQEDKVQIKSIQPVIPQLSFPLIDRMEDIEKAKDYYDQGMAQIKKESYLDINKASESFKKSLFHKFQDNPSLPFLILTYAKLLPHLPFKLRDKDDFLLKEKAGNAIFKLMELSKDKSLKDINVVLGASKYLSEFNKDQAALYYLEKYIKQGLKPSSIDFITELLRIYIRLEMVEKAENVFNTLSKYSKQYNEEAYLVTVDYLLSRKDVESALKMAFKGLEYNKLSVPILLKYAELLIQTKKFKFVGNILQAVNQLEAGKSILYYSKYLELSGMMAAHQAIILQNQKKEKEYKTMMQFAAFNLKKSLDLVESNYLRSTLASLEVGGDQLTQSLIKESKVKKLIEKSKEYIKAGDYKNAFTYAIEAVDEYPDNIDSQLYYVEIQTKNGFYNNSINSLNKLLDKYPLSKPINFALLKTYIMAFKLKEALRHMERIAHTDMIKTSEYASLSASLYKKSKNVILSNKWFKESLSRNPINDKDMYEYAEMMYGLKQYENAKKLLLKAQSLDPSSVEYKILYAKILYETTDADAAVGYLNLILAEFPNHPEVISEIARYYLVSGQYKMYEEYEKRADELEAGGIGLYGYLLERAMEDNDKAKISKYLKKLIKVDPGNIERRITLAQNLLDSGDLLSTLEELEQVKVRLNSYPRLEYLFAKTYLLKGDIDKAITHALQEIKNNPYTEHGYIILGNIYKDKGDYDKALKYYFEGQKINKDSIEALLGVADIQFERNNIQEAAELLQKIAAIDPDNAKVKKKLGQVYMRLGQGALAVESFKQYLSLNPDAPDKAEVSKFIKDLQ